MILDEVLYESSSFDMDDMVDIFTEGFLYALEMQEAGYKAGSTEELSENLIEAASIAISELNVIDNRKPDGRGILARAEEKSRKLRDEHEEKSNHYFFNSPHRGKKGAEYAAKSAYHRKMGDHYGILNYTIREK